MEWSDFYDQYGKMSASKLRSCIARLEEIDAGYELADVVEDVTNEECKALLVRKAIRLQVELDLDDFERLCGEIPSELCGDLARTGNLTLGTAEEITATLESLFDETGKTALYERALRSGVRFTRAQLARSDECEEEEEEEEDDEAPRPRISDEIYDLFLTIFGLRLLFGKRKKDKGKRRRF